MAPRTSPGLRQITEAVGALDAEVFEAIANSRSPLLDRAMPALSRAAENGKLWFAIGAALALSGSRSARRGAGRGVVSLAVTGAITNQLAKRLWRRKAAPFRIGSAVAASAASAVGVGVENPELPLHDDRSDERCLRDTLDR
ncbi:MAG TPA: hypothetical protein VMC78_12920 [Mycobacterium sp.]|nr:hypothetical protein [Mycobacterium sp.]